jgi:hypothetical protein
MKHDVKPECELPRSIEITILETFENAEPLMNSIL